MTKYDVDTVPDSGCCGEVNIVHVVALMLPAELGREKSSLNPVLSGPGK
jgi:hypothetical protein